MQTDKKLLPLLSGSFRNLLEEVENSFNDPVAGKILMADSLIRSFNNIIANPEFTDAEGLYIDKTDVLNTIYVGIQNIINNDVRMMSMRKGEFEISFLPEGKEPVYLQNNVWGRQNRQSAKPTRLIQKLLKLKFSCAEFEVFNNHLKAACLGNYIWRIMEGVEITKYYCYNNYVEETGTLGNSCMRYSNCSNFFEVYEDNAKMLTLYDPKEDLIAGRALFWEIDGKVYLDRIYTCEDHQIDQFIAFAKEKGWYIRMDNRLLESGWSQSWLGPEDNYTAPRTPTLRIQLTKRYEEFPYMDSFRYYDMENNTIQTTYGSYLITLDSTDGSIGDRFVCAECGRVAYGSDAEDAGMIWSDWEDDYLCEECAIWVDAMNDYVSCSNEMATIIYTQGTYAVPEDYAYGHPENFTKIDGTWYDVNYEGIVYLDELQCYVLKDENDEDAGED